MANAKDDLIVFKEEPPVRSSAIGVKPWKILIVDDEEEVHAITTLVLKDFMFDGRPLVFLHAYGSSEAERVMEQTQGIAIVLLDVVMEKEDSGLALVRWIRERLGEKLTRIILRTGQPGAAPEKQIITRYDINDYKEKTELTDTKLWTTITVALRGYRDLSIISRSKRGLEKIVAASVIFSERQSLSRFFDGVLTQMTSLLHADEDSMLVRTEGFAIQSTEGRYRIVSATGSFQSLAGKDISEIGDNEVRSMLKRAIDEKRSFFEDRYYIAYMKTDDDVENLVLLRSPEEFKPEDREIIKVFSSNASIALLNVSLSKAIEDSQSEMIFTLGEVVESRSIETGWHVRRVAALAAVIAREVGMQERDVELLRFAVPLHDIGKIGISDTILNKPGPLTDEEMIEMRKHTLIGYNLLRGGANKSLQLAATIALTHHERWDGNGYPQGLAGGDIPLVGRITCLVDVFDALFNTRVYKPAWDIERVVRYINDNRESQFDPHLIDVFNRKISEIRSIMESFKEPSAGL